MIEYGMTIKEAAEKWVNEMDAIETAMIDIMMSADIDDWQEVTSPSIGDRVYVYGKGRGTISGWKATEDGIVFNVEMDESLLKPVYGDDFDDGIKGREIEVPSDEFDVEYDSILPLWYTMWSFSDGCDNYWLEEKNGIQLMSECGFRIFKSEQFGYFFGLDGGGYDFYEAHWIPLYKKRGFHWHDPMTESGSFVMKEDRRADLYKGLLHTLSEMIPDRSELVNALKSSGFTDVEIAYEGLEVI